MAPPAVTTFDPDTKYRLLLRVETAEDLAHKSTQGAYCKLYVSDTALVDGSHKKLTKSTSSESNTSGDADDDAATSKDRVFRTQTRAAAVNSTSGKSETLWDESFEVSLRDPSVEVLSLRVKSQHRFFCPVVGTFAVYLRHLRVGLQADQWFPLRRGKKETGRIRLHLLLTPEHTPLGRAKKRNGSDMAPDAKVALAASFEADRAIQRLVNKQLKDEEERKARLQQQPQSDNADPLAKQLDVLAVVKVKEPTTAVSALGSGRGSGRSEPRFAVLLPTSPSVRSPSNQADSGVTSRLPSAPMTSPATNGSRSSPVAPRTFFGGADSRANGTDDVNTVRASDAERERRRAANFARLKDLDALELPVEPSIPILSVGSGRGSSRRRTLPSTGADGSQTGSQRANALYSIPSFGLDDLESQREKRLSSTDSDAFAEYERRLDRKLRKVRKETEKLRKIKRQLRKYIPDLSDSDESSSDASSTSEDERADNQRRRKGSSRRSSRDEPTQSGSARSGVSSNRIYV